MQHLICVGVVTLLKPAVLYMLTLARNANDDKVSDHPCLSHLSAGNLNMLFFNLGSKLRLLLQNQVPHGWTSLHNIQTSYLPSIPVILRPTQPQSNLQPYTFLSVTQRLLVNVTLRSTSRLFAACARLADAERRNLSKSPVQLRPRPERPL